MRIVDHYGMTMIDGKNTLTLSKCDNAFYIKPGATHIVIRNMTVWSVKLRWKSTFAALRFIWGK